jgi:hypothetical protein
MSAAPDPLVVIGFDAMDAGIARHLAAEGRMPALAGLLEHGAWSTVTNPPGLVVGSTWPSFWTGLWPSRHGFYCYQQVEPHSYKVRRYNPHDIVGRPFWLKLDEAGRRTCVLDVPLVPLTEPRHGVHVIDWGTHDRMLEFASHPGSFERELRDTEGDYPLAGRCDHYAGRGAHFCVGANLARMEAQVALTVLLRHFAELTLAVPDEQLQWRPANTRGPISLPLTLVPVQRS